MPLSAKSALAPIGAFLIFVVALATPAAAATYWVVVDPATHQCSIVQRDQKPAGQVIGNGYSSQDVAQSTTHRAIACGGVH